MSPPAPRDAAVFEVREALAERGCVVCRLSLRSVARVLKSIAYEQVNDIELRGKLRRSGGFCNVHAHQWLADSQSLLGTALIYRDVLTAAMRQLETPEVPRRSRLRTLLTGSTSSSRCPACQAQSDAEARYVGALLALAEAEPDLLEGADAMCRRHLLAAIHEGGDGAAHIADCARRRVDSLVSDLDEVIRKEDYRFRHEPRTEAERSAAARAIAWAAGLDGIVDI